MKISDIEDLKEVFRGLNETVVGVGVSAFNRLGPDKFIPGYQIICLANGQDMSQIKKDVKVLSVEEKAGKRLGIRRNTLSLLSLEEVKNYINSLENPYLLFYRVTKGVNDLSESQGWNVIGNGMTEDIEDKAFLREILDKCGLPPIPGESCDLKDKSYGDLGRKYGGKTVIQMIKSSGGKGTFFINSEKEFNLAKKKVLGTGETEVVITKFIEGPSPSVTACVTKHGTLRANLQYQLMDIEDVMNPDVGNGVFCGHDWTSSDDFTEEVRKQADLYANKIGEYLKGIGYKGIFGIDMVLDNDGKLYVVEINPRLLGSFPILNMIQYENSEPPLIMFHILEFLGVDYDLDFDKVNELVKKQKKGSQLILFNKSDKKMVNKNSLRCGVNSAKGGKLVYLRPGYRMEDLKTEDEFIITDNPPFENKVFSPHQRIARLITLGKIYDKKTYKINDWAKEIVNLIYREYDFQTVSG